MIETSGHDDLCSPADIYPDDAEDEFCHCELVARVRADERERMAGLARRVQGGGIRDYEAEVRERLREQVEVLPVVTVDLDLDPHGKPISRQAVLLSDVLSLLRGGVE